MQKNADISGSCHCGDIRLGLTLSRDPAATELRACQCSFCRRHGARTFTDRDGHARMQAAEPGALQRYRFGLRTADYLICARCGVYIAALIEGKDGPRATINAAGLDLAAFRDHAAFPADYSGETADERIKRRLASWMPAELRLAMPELALERAAS